MPTCHALPLIAHVVDISPAGKPNVAGPLGVSARVMIGNGHKLRAVSKIAKRDNKRYCLKCCVDDGWAHAFLQK